MVFSAADFHGCPAGAKFNGHQAIPHFPAAVPYLGCAPNSQLALAVVAPALHGVVVEPRTCVRVTTRHLDCCPAGAQIDSHQVITHLTAAVPHIACAPNPQLAVVVVPPALHGVVVEPRTCVRVTTRHLDCCPAGAQIDSHQVITHLTAAVPHIACAPNPQLAVVVVPPALHGVVVEPRAGVKVTTTDLNGCPAGAQVNSHQAIPHLPAAVPYDNCAPDPQLPVLAVPPTPHGVVVEPRTCVKVTTTHLHHCAASAHINCEQVEPHLSACVSYYICTAADPQLAVAVISPAFRAATGACCAGVTCVWACIQLFRHFFCMQSQAHHEHTHKAMVHHGCHGCRDDDNWTPFGLLSPDLG